MAYGSVNTFVHQTKIDPDTETSESPNSGENITMVDSVERDEDGHVKNINVKSVRLPTTEAVDEAAKLATARKIQTDLASNEAAEFDGTSNIEPGVTGILATKNGGTGNDEGKAPTAGTADEAIKLKNERTIRTNLATTAAVTFDGTSNIEPGVTGILPQANGGTGNADGSAAKLTRSHSIDGMPFDGTQDIGHFGICTTEASTAAKVVTCDNFTLTSGARISVLFQYNNSASQITLNVNGTGAVNVWRGTDRADAIWWDADTTVDFVYIDEYAEPYWQITSVSREGYVCRATGVNSHAEGETTTASGTSSHAEGRESVASSYGAHAEGYKSEAAGTYSHAEGMGSKTGSSADVAHAEGGNTAANGIYSHAEGYGSQTNTLASAAHAEGNSTTASGTYSHAEGVDGTASGNASHAEGNSTTASGSYAHAEGVNGTASGSASHAEGNGSTASGANSHAEGQTTKATGTASHAEGSESSASGYASHAEGYGTEAGGPYSHAEGSSSHATSDFSHAEGGATYASAVYAHAEGQSSEASGPRSHAEGRQTKASGECSHSEGQSSEASGDFSHAEGRGSSASGDESHAEGWGCEATTNYSHAEGYSCIASAASTHAEGSGCEANGACSHAEGNGSKTGSSASAAHAEGNSTTASGNNSHSEGSLTTASGSTSHAEGLSTKASSFYSHAEGDGATASANASHAEGIDTEASGNASHAEGSSTVASGDYSHAEGYESEASGSQSHAEGYGTIAPWAYSHACGLLNDGSKGGLFFIGYGSFGGDRSNCFRVTAQGQVYALSAFNSSGADYAEYVKEWGDGNPDKEDRVGYFVTLKDGKLEKAQAGDHIIGITSGNPSIVGNADEDYYWAWERDEFNRFVTQEVPKIEVVAEKQEDGSLTFKEVESETETETRYVRSAEWDSAQQKDYVARKDRPEWDYVGMLGMLPVRDDGTCEVGGLCKCGEDGIGTKAEERGWDTYLVVERRSDNVVVVILK